MSKKNSNLRYEFPWEFIPVFGTLSLVAVQLSLFVFAFISLIKGLMLAWAQSVIMFLVFAMVPPLSTVSGAIYFVAGVDIPKTIMVELRSNQGTQAQPVMTPAK